ncbi:pre-mRNA splicing factor [Coccidioides immitis RS]|uniref:U4/U6 snRNA-associated-splicing factor PRP24 n=1 Tax=Coccidioides immitis (strain RS) TaxID=246410 RepID=J3KFY8_COCIM|nr:pre-mRNA splicing factor [Coccidioides immitis RS]EAS34587.3 pre-mRNA splicing factor [Coccidioides immitis RS]
MDINSLLSHDSTPSSQARNPSANSPRRRPSHNLRSNPARQNMTSSPLVHQVLTPSNLREPSPPAISPVIGPVRSSGGTPPSSDLPPPRQASTPGMDTLADLASMQQHQPQRSNAPRLRNAESYESQLSPSTMYPNVPPVAHTTPTPRPFESNAADGSGDTPRRDYSNTCLAPDARKQATDLCAEVQRNPHAYDARVKFIKLLHQGFVDHVYPPSSPGSRGDPHKYDVLKDLRAAREELDNLFAIGEDLWVEWIQDESLLARTVEERISVMELCQRSVEEEFGSTRLWIIYGDWMLYLYNSASNSGEPAASQAQWSEEDKVVGREVFGWQSVMDVWRKGAEATRWRISDSHLVWNRYLELTMRDLASSPTSEKASQVRALFESRLQTPHMAWDQTFQIFSNFVSTYYNANYEDIMVSTNAKAGEIKAICDARETSELALQRAVESNDTTAEWTAYTQYLELETTHKYKKPLYGFQLITALFQRALLRFPTDANLWDDYVIYIVNESMHRRTNEPVIPILERAARHCPWSGSLWSQLLLSAERAGYSFQDISDLKHRATRTGLLEAAGVDEVLKVHTTWCSYLRRLPFQSNSTDEDLDVAEVGMRSAIESVQAIGDKGDKTVPNDPLFRLERIYIRYLSESGSWDSARETFKGLVGRHGHTYEFWLMFYTWELLCWSKFTQGDGPRKAPSPHYATAVLKQALQRDDLDWPEKIMDTYIAHCEQYEDAEELQLAIVEIRRVSKRVAKRREKEALEAAAQQQAAVAQAVQAAQNNAEDTVHVGKRKRESADVNGLASKKPKAEVSEAKPAEPEAEHAPKRDRENSSVSVKNLPRDVPTLKIRQFFRDCGKINAVTLLPADGDSASAIVEFDSKDDAEVAQTRDQKVLEGRVLSVQLETKATLFVTNFPPEADESYIRRIFSPHGEIVEVRFPSLKFNTHRRFCYVQFASAADAHDALELDHKSVGKNLNLVVKISDPSKRQARSGAFEEGREIHISNLDWKATEDDLIELFTAFGKVEVARIPTKADGGSKGFGFVAFSTPEAANAALAMDQKEFRSRPLRVRLSTHTGAKRQSTTIISRVGRSKSPSMEPNGGASPSTASVNQADLPVGERNLRTLGLMNIPDTVNDARIRTLVEPYGPLVKIILRPDHQGAIVEFMDVGDAGKAALGLDGQEIAPGRQIRVGPVSEMLKQPPEHKVDRLQVGKQKQKQKPALMVQPAAPISRPGQQGRAGRRGGLGVKKGAFNGKIGPASIATKAEAQQSSADRISSHDHILSEAPKPKSNDDFRVMLSQPKTKSEEI